MKETTSDIKQYLEERGWDNLKPGDLAKSISIEAAELLELFQWTNDTLEEVRGNPTLLTKIKEELADVLIYCFDMAVLLDFDVKEIIRDKINHINTKFPPELVKGDQEAYHQRKQEYRNI